MNRFKSLFAEFGVTSEQKLFEKLMQDSNKIPCIECGREYPIEQLSFLTDDPICERCRRM